MSAFIVSEAHINTLVCAGLHRRGGYGQGPLYFIFLDGLRLNDDTATTLGRMLWAENVASVRYRYPDCAPDDLPGPIPTPDPERYFVAFSLNQPLNPVAVLKLLSSYEYQSCEHPAWEASDAKRYCDALRHDLITRLPGYDDAPWEV